MAFGDAPDWSRCLSLLTWGQEVKSASLSSWGAHHEDRCRSTRKKTGRTEGGEAYAMDALPRVRDCAQACSGIYLIAECPSRL